MRTNYDSSFHIEPQSRQVWHYDRMTIQSYLPQLNEF